MKDNNSAASRASDSSVEPADYTDQRAEVALVHILNIVLRYRRLVFGLPLALFAVVLVAGLLQQPKYVARASLIPQEADNRNNAGLGGLAAQFGFSVPGDGQSPELYVQLLTSRAVLTDVLRARVETAGGRQTILSQVAPEEVTGPLVLEHAVEQLKSDLHVNADRTTGIVQMSVEASTPRLAEQIAQHLLDAVSSFNHRRRLSQARSQREFLEGRLRERGNELHKAEGKVAEFLMRNRQYEGSPMLRLQYEQLQRQVMIRQQVYTALEQSYEQARIDAVRSTPEFTVLDPPHGDARGKSRGLAVKGIAALFLGGVVSVSLAFLIAYLSDGRRSGTPEFVDFEALRGEMLRGARDLVRIKRSNSLD